MTIRYYYNLTGNKITSLAAITDDDVLYFKVLWLRLRPDTFSIQSQTGSDFLYKSFRTIAPRNHMVDLIKGIPWDEYDK